MRKVRNVVQKTIYVPAHEVDGKLVPIKEDGKQVQFFKVTGVQNYLKKHGLNYFFKEKQVVTFHSIY